MAQPTCPFDVRAIAPYTARNPTEVSLEVGNIYRVLTTDGRGLWWQTKTEDGSGVGWFPASYTEVIPSAVVEPPPVVAAPPPVTTMAASASVTPASTTYSSSAAPVQTQSSSSNERPRPGKQSVEKGVTLPCFVTLHLVEAKDLAGAAAKMTPAAFVYKREVMVDGKKAKPIFSTLVKNKTNSPKWNEEFKLFIKDAELEVICVRFCAKNDFKSKKEVIGEVEFPLRGAVRKFDKPNGQYQWFPIKGGKDNKDKVGEALIFIEFEDTRVSEGPKNVKHEGHVGLTAGGGFEIQNIPQEWKQLFRVLNIKKKDLEANPEMAKEVLNIMTNAANEGLVAPHQNTASPPPTPQHSSVPQPPPHQSSGGPPPAPAIQNTAAPAPPPPPMAKGPAPPPPPPAASGPKPPPPPSAHTAEPPTPASAPVPTPAPAPTPAPSSGGGSIFDQIKAGGVKLKKAEIAEVEKGSASTGNALADTLINAMSKYRADIAGNDKADDEDDWSE